MAGATAAIGRTDWADCRVCGCEVTGGDIVLGRPCGHQVHPDWLQYWAHDNTVAWGIKCPGSCGFSMSVPPFRTEELLCPGPAAWGGG